MSLKRFAVALPRLGVNADAVVVSDAVWQRAQPMELNRLRPFAIDVAPPGTVVDGVGGARRRMNIANCTVSLNVATDVVLKFVWSSGVALTRHAAGRPLTWSSPGSGRSCVNSSLLTPISTL